MKILQYSHYPWFGDLLLELQSRGKPVDTSRRRLLDSFLWNTSQFPIDFWLAKLSETRNDGFGLHPYEELCEMYQEAKTLTKDKYPEFYL